MTNEIHSRAAKGGQVGANGEWYVGGQFIATTDHAKGSKKAVHKTGRVEIEPYVWVDGREGWAPIFPMRCGSLPTEAPFVAYGSGKRWVKRIDGTLTGVWNDWSVTE